MSCKVKYIKLKRSDNYGFGFSVLGGAGSELPPIVYDVIEGSPASNSNQLSPGDIILEINGQEVLNFTTKEVLNCLRLSTREVILKLKSDTVLKEKVHHLRQTPNNSEILRNAITQDDLQGVKEIVAKKSETKNEDVIKSASPKKELAKDSSSGISSSSSEHDDKVEINNYTVCQQEKTHKSENNLIPGDLTLDFSRTSQNSDFLPQKLINNVKKSTSMPTSPNDKDKGLDSLSKTDNHDFGSPQSLCSPLPPNENGACSSFIYPSASTLVRISKSEDYLQHQKDNMSSVNIELDDDVTSSLNTLLDTRDDDLYQRDDDPYPVCSSGAAVNSCALNNIINNDEVESAATVRSVNAPLTSSSPPDSIGHSSHDSDSPLIHSLTPVSPQSPTSSMQYSCSGIYNKMCSARDSLGSSNRSENVCSNSSSLTSLDTDVPDELEWDDTTPTFSPTNHNQIVNGFSDKNGTLGVPSMNGHSGRTCSSPTDSSMSENMVQKIDENRIIIKVAGPEKIKKKKHSSHRKPPSQGKEAAVNGDPDRTPTNTPPQTPGSGTLSPETLAYQQLWESEDEITCLSEKSDESSCASANKRPTSATSPPMSEDESDIESLHSFHYSPKAVDIPSAVRLAKRLFALDGFKKSDVSRHLSKNNEFSKAVAEEYLRYFNFSKDTLDIALRKFLDKFCLSGETQERERVLVHFSKRYLDCNPGQFNSQDAVHTLTCALMLLNTDLHNQNIGRKMTCSEFIDNLAELNDGENFQADILRALYFAIKSEPLKWAADDGDESSKGVGQGLLEEAHRVIGSNPFLSTPIGSGVVYKKGYIMRKCCVEPSGKKTAFGKRSWKMWFCVIQDLVLYLHKDEQGARRGPPPQMGQNAVRLHHALAQKALDYSKKEHVFRLQTADQAEYLLQTSDSKELQAWIDAINFVAASLSAPPMPGAVGSQKKFQRPLLPCSITKLNVVEQLEDHSARVNQIEVELDDLKTNPLDKNAKSATVSSHKEKLAHLTSELRRYQNYVHLLRSRLESTSGISKVIVGTVAGVNPLPVFDGVEVKEVGPEEVGDPSSAGGGGGIVPPPIPERSTRHADSDDGESFQDRGMQTSDAGNKFLGRNKKDEFQKELEKMIKEKEKKDKKREKLEKKEQADTLKRKTKEQKNMTNENHKNNDDKKEETEKEGECQEDPRIGTFARMSALFKFSKLNRSNQGRASYCEEVADKPDNDQSSKIKSKGDNDIASLPPSKVDDIASFPPESTENKTLSTPQPLIENKTLSTPPLIENKTLSTPPPLIENKTSIPSPFLIESKTSPTPPPLIGNKPSRIPPPLPPKPGPNSAIMKNLGTRVINV